MNAQRPPDPAGQGSAGESQHSHRGPRRRHSRGQGGGGQHPLALDQIERLLALMSAHGVAEFEQNSGGHQLRIRLKEPHGAASAASASPSPPAMLAAPVVPLAPQAPAAREPAPVAAPTPAAPALPEGVVEFKSPMVGTFYRAPSPDAQPFVKVGDRVNADTTLCLIEAMKVMNEIKAETNAEVVEILVQNGEAVEYGQPLLLLRPTR